MIQTLILKALPFRFAKNLFAQKFPFFIDSTTDKLNQKSKNQIIIIIITKLLWELVILKPRTSFQYELWRPLSLHKIRFISPFWRWVTFWVWGVTLAPALWKLYTKRSDNIYAKWGRGIKGQEITGQSSRDWLNITYTHLKAYLQRL